jgi:hypothetical protein
MVRCKEPRCPLQRESGKASVGTIAKMGGLGAIVVAVIAGVVLMTGHHEPTGATIAAAPVASTEASPRGSSIAVGGRNWLASLIADGPPRSHGRHASPDFLLRRRRGLRTASDLHQLDLGHG